MVKFAARVAVPGLRIGNRPSAAAFRDFLDWIMRPNTRMSSGTFVEPLFLKSGAQVNVVWHEAEELFDSADHDHYDPSVRVCIKPSAGEIENWSAAEKKALLDFRGSRDFSEQVAGSVGYFGIGFPPVVRGRQNKTMGKMAVVWTWQMRALPALSRSTQNRFRQWDFQLLNSIERRLKTGGVRWMLIPAFSKNPLSPLGKINEALARRGYRTMPWVSAAYGFSRAPVSGFRGEKMPFMAKRL